MSSHSITTTLCGEVEILKGLHLDYECVITADVNVDHDRGDQWNPPTTDYEVTEVTSLHYEFKSYFDDELKDLTLMEYCLRRGEEYDEILQVVTEVANEYMEEHLNEYISQNACDLIKNEPSY
tara:strand:+ start:7846 stop:8214 length:369 start_codon:yes stop_codon:yes gene_type:complete